MKSNLKSLMVLTGMFIPPAFIGCQSQNEQTAGEPTAETETASEPEQQQTTGPKTDTVVIYQMQFQPANLTVNKGDTVVWINKDLVAHNVTEDPAGSVKSDTLNTGDSFKLVPDHSFNYICSIHPTMKAQLTVNE
ncbi:MAG: plastocyanin/azurin family copper-binding protein [Moheibacter sp.]